MDKRRRWKVHLEWGGCPGVPGGRRPGPAGAELRRRGRVPVFRRHGPPAPSSEWTEPPEATERSVSLQLDRIAYTHSPVC